MLREYVSKVLFDRPPEDLNQEEIYQVNKFIDNYYKVKELQEMWLYDSGFN